jgi:hypothetical protein
VMVVVRRFAFTEDAAALTARARAHMERQPVSEIDDVIAHFPGDSVTAAYQFYMPDIVGWHFNAKT